MGVELFRPKLLFRIVDCFNEGLHNQFVQEHKTYRLWCFEMILEFLDEQISNLKYRDQQLYDLSVIIGEEKGRGNKAYKSRYNTLHGKATYDQKQSKEAKGLRAGSSASSEKQVAVTAVGKRKKKTSCIIHPYAQLKITECEVFLEKEVNERRDFVKVNGLCFYCMQKHFAKYCPNKTPCSQYNGGHSQLLHQNDANRNKPEGDNNSAKVRKSNLPAQLLTQQCHVLKMLLMIRIQNAWLLYLSSV